jgi:gamma-glutamylcyclotransferase (GGCT)/AIG2-like uncharacterized protein YtfP
MKRTQFYFAYGANTNLDSMDQRCPGAMCLGAAQLEGYRFVFRRHADVELANPGDQVEGVIWQLDDIHLASLDAFEGFPNYYLRCKAWVHSNDIGWVKAWIYFMEDQDYLALPDNSYVSMCREGYLQNRVSTKQIDEALENLGIDNEIDYLGFREV